MAPGWWGRDQLKKPCPLNTSLVVEATVVSIVSDGLRINTEAKLQSFGPDPVVYATCKVQIVDYGECGRGSQSGLSVRERSGFQRYHQTKPVLLMTLRTFVTPSIGIRQAG